MADPLMQTFCCHRTPYETYPQDFLYKFNSDTYHEVCLGSSTIGILGALYQILPRKQFGYQSHRWYSASISRSRRIIVWLAVADLMASIGVFFRSLFWIHRDSLLSSVSINNLVILCAVSAAWIQYFYTAAWLWTLVYAVDMKLLMKEREGYPERYHFLVWSVPALLTTIGLLILYVPDANCHDIKSTSTAIYRVLPNYCAIYLPMALVMLANPIIYFSLSNDIEPLMARSLSQFTNKERHIIDLIRMKSAFINLTFYACWLPNLINGILLWVLWFDLPHQAILILWYIMALLNPMQALFNSLVYRKWSGGGEKINLNFWRNVKLSSKKGYSDSSGKQILPSESTPLIGSSINNSSGESESDNQNL